MYRYQLNPRTLHLDHSALNAPQCAPISDTICIITYNKICGGGECVFVKVMNVFVISQVLH